MVRPEELIFHLRLAVLEFKGPRSYGLSDRLVLLRVVGVQADRSFLVC